MSVNATLYQNDDMPNGKSPSGNEDTTQPRKPFYKRKRWIAAGVLWLALPALYVLASGPYSYCCGRGWCEVSRSTPYYRTFIYYLGDTTLGQRWFAYNKACNALGRKHSQPPPH